MCIRDRPGPILAQRTVVLDLTDESHGNFNGIGVADVTTKDVYKRQTLLRPGLSA